MTLRDDVPSSDAEPQAGMLQNVYSFVFVSHKINSM